MKGNDRVMKEGAYGPRSRPAFQNLLSQPSPADLPMLSLFSLPLLLASVNRTKVIHGRVDVVKVLMLIKPIRVPNQPGWGFEQIKRL